jgi:uncharacterized protein
VNDSTSATSPVWPTRWPKNSFTGAWTWLIAGFIAALFIIVFLFSIGSAGPKNISTFEVDVVIEVQFVVDALLVALLLWTLPSLSKFTLRELGFRMPGRATIITALIGAAAMFVVANGSATLIDYLAHAQHPQDIVQIFTHLHDPITITIFTLFAVVFAPFAEETLFRVFFFNLGLRYGGFWGGAITSGLLFGIAHGDVYALIPLALGGIVLCAVYYRTQNAYASMISHALFNSVSIVVLLAGQKVT